MFTSKIKNYYLNPTSKQLFSFLNKKRLLLFIFRTCYFRSWSKRLLFIQAVNFMHKNWRYLPMRNNECLQNSHYFVWLEQRRMFCACTTRTLCKIKKKDFQTNVHKWYPGEWMHELYALLENKMDSRWMVHFKF